MGPLTRPPPGRQVPSLQRRLHAQHTLGRTAGGEAAAARLRPGQAHCLVPSSPGDAVRPPPARESRALHGPAGWAGDAFAPALAPPWPKRDRARGRRSGDDSGRVLSLFSGTGLRRRAPVRPDTFPVSWLEICVSCTLDRLVFQCMFFNTEPL